MSLFNFALIFISFVLGAILRRTGRFPRETASVLNGFAIFISFPATVIQQVTRLFEQHELSFQFLIPVSMAWILFGLSYLVFTQLGKKLSWPSERTGALILTAGLGNTSFVGFPLLEALHGAESLQWGVIVDQLGSFLVLATLGIIVAGKLGRGVDARWSPLKNIFSFPPFLALLTALAISAGQVKLEGLTAQILERLAATLVPLALVAVGFQFTLSLDVLRRQWRALGLGLVFKLILVPSLMLVLYRFVLQDHSFLTRITILEAAMATMITSAVVAQEFKLDGELANLMVGVSIPLSLLTVPAWDRLLSFWF